MSVLRARDVWAAPPGAPDPVVRGLSLEVGAGEWVALQGPNGGGKTTLALVLAGLWPVERGTVEFEGRPLTPGQPPGAREGVAVLLQDPGVQILEPTVADELALAPRNLGRSEDEVRAAVARTAAALGLEGDLARDPRTLSAGRQQLVLLAGALTAGPRLLVADEAGAHLDASTRERVLAALTAELARGLAVVWVTQDPREAAVAHRTVIVGVDSGETLPEGAVPRMAAASEDGIALELEVERPADGGPRVQVSEPRRLEVAARGVTALEGPNGSGKSVLLAAAAGALELEQVRVRRTAAMTVPPLLVTQYPEHEIFEERVLDEVVWAAVQRGVPRERACAAAAGTLTALGLPPGTAERRVWGLSGGEKRLIQLAGALLAPADLLLLDEPTAGLDPARRAAAADAVLARARTTPVLVASQDSEWLDRTASRRHRLGS